MDDDSGIHKVAGEALFGNSQTQETEQTTSSAKQIEGLRLPAGCDEELRAWLQKYIVKYPHHTTKVLAQTQFIGVAKSALDAYIAGTYFLPRSEGGHGTNPAESKIEHAIRLYRQRIAGSERHGYRNAFLETHVWLQLRQACLAAMKEG